MFIKLYIICDHLFICDIYDLCSHVIQPIFDAESINFHILSCVITECTIMHYNNSCRFCFALYSFWIWQIQNSVFNQTCIKHIKCSLLQISNAWTVLYVGIVISFFIFTVQNCGARELADSAQQRKLCSFTTNFYAEITSCRQTSCHTPPE